jgi:hypothetical protein
MNIGLFGDSYIDTVWHRHPNPTIPPGRKMWAHRLLEELDAPFICSGLGGTSQYYAIAEWQRWSQRVDFDVAMFTFTWPHRLYTTNLTERVITARIEGRNLAQLAEEETNIQQAADLYYRYLYDEQEHDFRLEQMIRWCLELPEQYPKTKFIFFPNTRESLAVARQYHQQGVLMDFAFEQLTEAEGERVGIAPYIMDRTGHLSDHAHECVKNVAKDVVLNHNHCVYVVNIGSFNLTNLYPNYYD